MLWSFIKSHLRSKVIIFLSTCKQVKFMYEAFKKLRPGVPLRSLHGKMKQFKRMAVFYDFCEASSFQPSSLLLLSITAAFKAVHLCKESEVYEYMQEARTNSSTVTYVAAAPLGHCLSRA